MAEEALPGSLGYKSPTLMITIVLDTVMLEVDTFESPVVEVDEEGSNSMPRNNANEGDDTDDEE